MLAAQFVVDNLPQPGKLLVITQTNTASLKGGMVLRSKGFLRSFFL